MRGLSVIPALLLCLCLGSAYAQTISGIVTDSTTAVPLATGNVLLRDTAGRITGFALLDAEGAYAFDLTPEQRADRAALELAVRSLGYAEQSVPLAGLRGDTVINFTLIPVDVDLPEVVVAERRSRFKVRGDTVVFRAEAYADSTEFNVEDLLRKLPGFTVDDRTGQITFEGKPIARVMIDGDDLLGANYALGTKNLRADILEEVAVIEDYNDNPALRSLVNTDATVVDLRLKDEYRNVWTGSVLTEAGGGASGLKGQLSPMVFSIGRTAKTLLVGNVNNVGADPYGNLVTTGAAAGVAPLPYPGEEPPIRELYAMAAPANVGLAPRFTEDNVTGLASVATIVPLGEYTKLSVNAEAPHRELAQRQFSLRELFGAADTVAIAEVSDVRTARTAPRLSLGLTRRSPSGDRFLRLANATGYEREAAALDTRRTNPAVGTDTIASDLRRRVWRSHTVAEYTARLTDDLALQVHAAHTAERDDADFDAAYDAYRRLGPADGEGTAGPAQAQTSTLSSHRLHAYGQLTYRTFATVTARLGAVANDASLTGLSRFADAPPDLGEGAVLGELDHRLAGVTPYAALAATRRLRRGLKVTAGLMPAYFNAESQPGAGAPGRDRARLRWQPHASVVAKPYEHGTFRAGYRERAELPGVSLLASGRLWRDYQTLAAGGAALQTTTTRTAEARFSHRDNRRDINAYASATYRHQADLPYEALDFDDDFVRTRTDATGDFEALDARAGAEKLFYDLSVRLGVDYAYREARGPQRVNGVLADFASRSHVISADFGTAFEGWVNVLAEVHWSRDRFAAGAEGEASRLEGVHGEASVRVVPTPTWRLKYTQYWRRQRVVGFGASDFMTAEVRFDHELSWRERMAYVYATWVNPWGHRDYALSAATPFSSSVAGVEAVGSFATLGLDLSF